jgi:ankyrin repeat protein
VASGSVEGVRSGLAAHPLLVSTEEGGFLPMLRAAKEGHLGVLQELVRAGGALEALDKRGMTPVAVAARFGREEVLAWLLAQPAGVSVNVEDVHKCTPLHHAVLGNSAPCVRMLLAAPGLRKDALDALGNTPGKLARAQLKKGKASAELVALF